MKIKAAESFQVQKARKKLEKKMASEDKRLNTAAIDQMKKAIQTWIMRHQTDRIQLHEKNVELFDENRHSAKTKSRYIVQLVDKLKNGASAKKTTKTLKGRITK